VAKIIHIPPQRENFRPLEGRRENTTSSPGPILAAPRQGKFSIFLILEK
jgi:hypothetical protein